MVVALNHFPVFPSAGSGVARGLLKVDRRGCVVAEGLGCRLSRLKSCAPPGAGPGSSFQEEKVELSQEEGLLKGESPDTCAHFRLHLHCPPQLDLQSQNQSQSQSWNEPASQRRNL